MYSIALLALSSLFACRDEGTLPPISPSCQLTGTITGIGHRPIVFRYQHKGILHADTVRAVQDRFQYTAQASDDGMIELVIDPTQWTTFWYEPGQVRVVGNSSAPYQLLITGTPNNEVLTQYHQQVEWPYYANVRKVLATGQPTTLLRQQRVRESLGFVERHLTSQAATDILLWQTRYDNTQVEAYSRLFARMSQPQQASVQGKEVAKRLQILRNMPVVGKTAPDFTMPDTAGVATSLSRFRGRYVLLDFWGHWCGPCLQAMPAVSALHQQYGAQVAFLGVAAESPRDRQSWLRAIRRHQPAWPQLSELAGDDSPVLSTYNITAFPTYLLLDPKGVVITRTSDLTEVQKSLADLPLK
jgi:thiol-disulfide isomerase/thioredoxin